MNFIKQIRLLIISIIIPPILFACSSDNTDFDSSLIPVMTGTRWGYINLEGEYVINPQFDEASPFFGGQARVKKGDKYGYINKEGKYVINPQYTSATSFADGVAWVTRKGSAPILINKKGDELLICKEAEKCYSFSDGLAVVCIRDEHGNKRYGFIDRKGGYQIQAKYGEAYDFSDGMAYVVTADSIPVKGFVTKEKKELTIVLPDSLRMSQDLINGFLYGTAVIINNENEYGLIDKTGKIILTPQFSELEIDDEKLLACRINDSNEWGWCDKTGKIVINPQFDATGLFGKDNVVPVRINKEWGYINKEGKMIINPQFEYGMPFIDDKVAFVMSGSKFGLIDYKGKYIANPQFDDISREYVIYSVGYRYSESVETDFYDIDKAVSILENIVKHDSADGINFNSTIGKLLKKYNKTESDVYGYSGFYIISNRDIANMFDIEIGLDGNFVQYVSDGWWGATPLFIKDAKPKGINILVKPKGRGSDKATELLKAYAKKLKLDYDEGGASGKYGIFDIRLLPNCEGFSINLYPKSGKKTKDNSVSNSNDSDTQGNNYRYEGTIDGKYGIVMNLTFSNYGDVSGQYYYKSKKSPIELQGNINSDGVLMLEEKVNGKVTGNFAGKWSSSEYSGSWISADGNKEMPFKVVEQ